MPNLTTVAHSECLEVLNAGDIAIDATAGNGHDTLFLAQTVGENGHVYSFDIQEVAINTTKHRIEKTGLSNVRFIQKNHGQMLESIDVEDQGQIRAIMFNLGFLPGGEKTLTTQPENTLQAIEQSITLLKSGGVLSVLAYTGHPGGQEETDSVFNLLNSLNDEDFTFSKIEAGGSRDSPPQLFILKKA